MIFNFSKELEYEVPVADAGSNISVVYPETTTRLDGSKSIYNGSNSISYIWTQVYGPSKIDFNDNNLIDPEISNLNKGVYKIKLLVTDGVYSDSDEMFVIVND